MDIDTKKISTVRSRDFIGKFLALISLSHIGIFAGFVTLITFRRDLHTITLFIGVLLNELICMTLKYIIAEPRPYIRNNDQLYSEYGMPSSHATMMFYLSTYMFYFMFIRTNYVKVDFITHLWKILITTMFFVWAIMMAISRVYLKYHSIEQVVCGAIVGIIFGTVWFVVTQFFLTPLYPAIVSWRISEFLLIRDTTLIPNILWFEYTSARLEDRTRRYKCGSRKSQ
ncbi:dolichyldiphosphatase 1-like isoform X2 [Planococcus citri]|uniref:dolichyldiphosphatase 1-like isoform X2 n=1 Tax=Planococcus citri TaxID=170843 RepID=UPI0031F7BD6A